MPSGVGSSLSRIPPPPLTWRSMKPGASKAPSGNRRCGQSLGTSPHVANPRMRPSSISTAASLCQRRPSKTRWPRPARCPWHVMISGRSCVTWAGWIVGPPNANLSRKPHERFGMDRLVIRGGNQLKGSVQIHGAKNAALPQIAAVLLSAEPLEIGNVPDLLDVTTMLGLMQELGVTAERRPGGNLLLDPRAACNTQAPYEIVRRMRASILVL